VNATDTGRTGAAPAAGLGRPADDALPVPVIAVTRGRPTDAELAAVTAVLLAATSAATASAAAAAASAQAARRPRPSLWAADRGVRSAPPPGPHAWRASALPR
jgi:hypothetical protein